MHKIAVIELKRFKKRIKKGFPLMGTFINKRPPYTYMCTKNKNKLRDFS